MNYYEALEVPSTASADVINDQYQILANKWHPDKNRGNTAAAERFKLIGEAYQSLTDPAKRSAYDLSQRQAGQGLAIVRQVSTRRARVCPKNIIATWPSATWYELSAAPGVFFCSFCYEEHIAATRFGQAFREVPAFPPRPMRCGYWAPRVRILFNGALKTGDLSPLVAYLEIRASMPDCLGSRGYVPGPEPRMEWFTLKVDPNNPNDSLSGFIVCRACYEDVVMATPHYTHFRKHWRTQLPDQVWTCDVGNGWGRLVLNPFVSNNQDLVWSAVVTKLCSGFRKKCYRKSRNHTELWWRLRDNLDIKSLAVCDPCHKRFIAPSDYLTEWEPVSQSEPLISPSIQEPLLACAMSDSRLLCSWEIARLLGLPVSTWREVALVILHCEPCTRQEEIGKKWYRITSSPNLCNICSGCYYTFFYALGFGSHFYRDTVNPDDGATSQRRICDLYPYSPYFPTLIRKLYEAGAVGDIDIFLRYVRERKDLRLCPLGHVEADPEPMRWYGDGDSFIACEECYFDVIRNSSLAQHVRRCDPRNSSQYQRCTLWSDRMRTQWANACQRGDLTEFTDFCKTRAWAFKETMFRAIQMNREINTQRGLGAGERGEAKATIDRLFQQWQGWC